MGHRVSVWVSGHSTSEAYRCRRRQFDFTLVVVPFLSVILDSLGVMTVLNDVVSGCCEAFWSLMCVFEWCEVKGEA